MSRNLPDKFFVGNRNAQVLGCWAASLVEHPTLDRGVMRLSPMLGGELIKKKNTEMPRSYWRETETWSSGNSHTCLSNWRKYFLESACLEWRQDNNLLHHRVLCILPWNRPREGYVPASPGCACVAHENHRCLVQCYKCSLSSCSGPGSTAHPGATETNRMSPLPSSSWQSGWYWAWMANKSFFMIFKMYFHF